MKPLTVQIMCNKQKRNTCEGHKSNNDHNKENNNNKHRNKHAIHHQKAQHRKETTINNITNYFPTTRDGSALMMNNRRK